MLTQSASLYKQDSEAFVSFIKHHVILFTDWMKDVGEIDAINSSPKLFEYYVSRKLQEIDMEESKTDAESIARRKRLVEVDRWPEIAEQFLG